MVCYDITFDEPRAHHNIYGFASGVLLSSKQKPEKQKGEQNDRNKTC